MKKIIYIIMLIIMSKNLIFGQDINSQIENAAQDLKIPAKEMAKFRESFTIYLNELKKKKPNKDFKATEKSDICDDGGFENNNFSNWNWALTSYSHENVTIGFTPNTSISTATGTVFSRPIVANPPRNASEKWEIIPLGTDPLIPSISTVHSGNYSLKLGDKVNFADTNNFPWKSAEGIQKTISVTNSNKTLKFWYSVITNDASALTSHAYGLAAGFGVRVNSIFQPINPVPPGSSNSPIYAYNNPGLINKVVQGRDISYLPWTCSSVDLSAFVGQTVTVEFLAFDCVHTGHFAYAYIDDICLGCEETEQKNQCCDNRLLLVSASTVPPSYPYNGGTYAVEQYNFNVPSSAPITDLKIEVTSFEWLNAPDDCKECKISKNNLGSILGSAKIGGIIIPSTVQPYGSAAFSESNINEVVFSFPSGKNITIGDYLKLIYLLPSDKNLSCCQTKAKVCRKISWKDINCNYCEVYDCSEVELKNKSELKAGYTLPNIDVLNLNIREIYSKGRADGF